MRKLDFTGATYWTTHRSGWKYAIDALNERLGDPKAPVRFLSHLETDLSRHEVGRPWIGFFHNVPVMPDEVIRYWPAHKGLGESLCSQEWIDRKDSCRGLLFLTEYTANFARQHTSAHVLALKIPSEIPQIKFDWGRFTENSTIALIGTSMRRFDTFPRLQTTLAKLWVTADPNAPWRDIFADLQRSMPDFRDRVRLSGRLTDRQYDDLLASSVMYLDVYDMAASVLLVECIARNTPVLIPRLPSAVEYLGQEYPLFFDDEQQAAAILADPGNVKAAHFYLRSMDKSWLSGQYFARSLEESMLYQSI